LRGCGTVRAVGARGAERGPSRTAAADERRLLGRDRPRPREHPARHVSGDVRLRARRRLVRAHPRAASHRQADPPVRPLRRAGRAHAGRSLTLAEAAAQADALAEAGDERALADLRKQWDDELEHAARSQDYRERAVAYRAI